MAYQSERWTVYSCLNTPGALGGGRAVAERVYRQVRASGAQGPVFAQESARLTVPEQEWADLARQLLNAAGKLLSGEQSGLAELERTGDYRIGELLDDGAKK